MFALRCGVLLGPMSLPRLFFFRRFTTSSKAHHRHGQCGYTNSTRWQKPRFAFTVKMSSAGAAGIGAAGLYAIVSNPAQIGARPEEAEERSHHLQNGKGFVNPWDSFRDFNPFKIMLSMVW